MKGGRSRIADMRESQGSLRFSDHLLNREFYMESNYALAVLS